jgi:ABC-type Na+ transport system ATPase subunit NatA
MTAVDAEAEQEKEPEEEQQDEQAVRCDGLEYSFGATRAVDRLDLEVRPGEVFGLLGPNGAGKTTAMRAITTLLPVPAGMVQVFGRDCSREPMAVRRLLGYVPQQLSADSGLTGRENVALFARVFDVSRRERAARVAEALAAVGLTEAADRLAGTYSGGMVRRLELAQALVSAPRLLILDEPTIGLDPIARTSVLLGVAVIVVLGSAFFSCLSMSIAGIVLTRDRLMGIGQAITMPLFFGSNALYPVAVMPGWLQAISKVNPLSYEVDALRGLLLRSPSHLGTDYAVLVVAAALGIAAASALLGRLAR